MADASEDTAVPRQERYPAAILSAALNSSFASSPYNSNPFCNPLLPQNFQISEEVFRQESGLLQYTGMLVPLSSPEVATCSKSAIFQYTALHVQDPSLDHIPFVQDYRLPSPQLRDLDDSSIPEHVRKGIDYDKEDMVDFRPEVS